ncbi:MULTISPECIES: hypothetical protein [Rhizobium]|uniref:Uncharacterized protein n=1 Tax=Rhizobium esperanzae TaxID=1967781 RepID=A0A7W6XY93_9HYPH|nr:MULTISPECIES: hypothetical protein [Rhizobium]MBB4440735.1 hypothetical protein [Rhizobium esperanzae]MDH6203466.1 hypothetical protein [Rhizobium leguminosarum]
MSTLVENNPRKAASFRGFLIMRQTDHALATGIREGMVFNDRGLRGGQALAVMAGPRAIASGGRKL